MILHLYIAECIEIRIEINIKSNMAVCFKSIFQFISLENYTFVKKNHNK